LGQGFNTELCGVSRLVRDSEQSSRRQANKAAYLPTAVRFDRWMGASLSRCFASGRGTSPLPAQSPFQCIPQNPDDGLRYSRRRDSN